ncbi:MAG TPA: type II toxin-antitoxin system VapC family toxin [Caulobacteraceae bacterium]|nr:type II toxin-antitoxin system VapC family toxin [Caulobacteraceae bacterium]
MRFLLDTNAVSEPRQARPNAGYMRWIDGRDPDELAISALTYGELTRGIASLADGRRRSELSAWLAEALTFFGDRILPVDVGVAAAWAEVWLTHRRLGKSVGVVDELTAATAMAHGLAVVTRNVRDFEHSGCDLLTPWST